MGKAKIILVQSKINGVEFSDVGMTRLTGLMCRRRAARAYDDVTTGQIQHAHPVLVADYAIQTALRGVSESCMHNALQSTDIRQGALHFRIEIHILQSQLSQSPEIRIPHSRIVNVLFTRRHKNTAELENRTTIAEFFFEKIDVFMPKTFENFIALTRGDFHW